MKIGRPLKYETPDDLIKAIDEYFEGTKFDEWTVTGLALVIGSKQLFQDYQGREGFSDIVKRAKLMIENSYEVSLRSNKGTPTGPIFALKNLGWTDNQQITHDINHSDISDDELISRINKLAQSGKEG